MKELSAITMVSPLDNIHDMWNSSGEQGQKDEDLHLRPITPSCTNGWEVTINGPRDSCWEDSHLRVQLNFCTDSPKTVPHMCFPEPIFHPNVHPRTGVINPSALFHGRANTRPESLQNIVDNLEAMLTTPVEQYPVNENAWELYQSDLAAYEEKIRDCIEKGTWSTACSRCSVISFTDEPLFVVSSPSSSLDSQMSLATQDTWGSELSLSTHVPDSPLVGMAFLTIDDTLSLSPAIIDVPKEEQEQVALAKIRFCCNFMDLDQTNTDEELSHRDTKLCILEELFNFLTYHVDELSPELYEALFRMLEINMLQPLPSPTKLYGQEFSLEEDDDIPNVNWDQVQFAYEIFLAILNLEDLAVDVVRNHLTTHFIYKLMERLGSEDCRERDSAKLALHCMYGRLLPVRGPLRQAFRDCLQQFIFDDVHHNGIAEVLEIMGTIINGFAVPLKEEHVTFLTEVLLPLHKSRQLVLYFPQLQYCVTDYLIKSPDLIPTVLKSLKRMWPTTNHAKQLMFVEEIESIITEVPCKSFRDEEALVLAQIFAREMGSTHFLVAERVFSLFKSGHVMEFAQHHCQTMMPLLAYQAKHKSANHWHRKIRGLSGYVCEMLKEIDYDGYMRYCDVAVPDETESRKARWAKIEAMAAARQTSSC